MLGSDIGSLTSEEKKLNMEEGKRHFIAGHLINFVVESHTEAAENTLFDRSF